MNDPTRQSGSAALPSFQAIQQFYDRVYREHGLSDPAHIYQRVIRLLRPVPGHRLLDVACGEGRLVACAHQARLEATGIDLSLEAIRQAGKRCAGTQLIVGDGEALPFPDQTFEYVTSLGSLEHYRSMARGLDEMARVLKADGLACIMVPNVFWLGDVLEVLWRGACSSGFQIIERHGTRKGWERLLAAHGLVVDRTLRYNKPYPLFAPSSWKIKSIPRFLWRNLFNAVCPFNLSLEFIYLCRKTPPCHMESSPAAS